MVAVLPPSTKKKHKSKAQSGRPAGSPFFYEDDPFSLRAQSKSVRRFSAPRLHFRVLSSLHSHTVPATNGPGSAY